MENWGEALAVALSGLAIAGLALYLRIYIHIGKTPSGVDTWYFLAYARELRRTWRMPVRLKGYLLQDEEQSYPPLFPVFLALLPPRLLERYYWLVSPLLDCVHLLFLHVVAFKISESVPAAIVASLIYALTPQLISETRSLNSRAFGALIQSLAMMALLRYVIGGDGWLWLAVALVLASAVFLAHSLTAISFGVTTVVLSAVLQDWRFLVVLTAAPVLATLVTGGLYIRGVRGHLQSARFWRQNKFRQRSHQVLDSPMYGDAGARAEPTTAPPPPSTTLWAAVRLIGENPFVLALLAAALLGQRGIVSHPWGTAWGTTMFWWAAGVFGWAVATTFAPLLRVFGPGYLYIKTSTFPTAYTLGALVVGGATHSLFSAAPQWLSTELLVGLAGFPASMFSLWYFYRHIRTRKSEHTATAPPGLQSAARYLAGLPGQSFACLPTMYADYMAYQTGKRVLWGGHSGDPARLDGFYPVISRPLQEFFHEYGVDYFVLDLDYVELERLALDGWLAPLQQFERFCVFQVVVPETHADGATQPMASVGSAEER